MKLKLHRGYEHTDWRESSPKYPNGLCYPHEDTESVELWCHLFPENYNKSYHNYTSHITTRVEFLAKAHGWEIEWMKD